MRFWGKSFISDPFGKVIKRGSGMKEEIVTAELDLERNDFYAEGGDSSGTVGRTLTRVSRPKSSLRNRRSSKTSRITKT